MKIDKLFEKQRYAYLKNVLTKKKCAELTAHMFELFDQGKLFKDEQCPISDSVYGDPLLDNTLSEIQDKISQKIGIDLLPTYSYARIYRPGEVLEKHTDRESCEISGTITLGIEKGAGDWPIYFEKDGKKVEYNIKIGDMVIYRGGELEHWRDKFEGNWHVQLFCHYVDANGPYKDHAYDKRNELGQRHVSAEIPIGVTRSTLVYSGVGIKTHDGSLPGLLVYNQPPYLFTQEECARIIETNSDKEGFKATIGSGSDSRYDSEIREVINYNIQPDQKNVWIFEKLANAIAQANTDYYKYNLIGITHEIQLLRYRAEDKGHYDWHVDIGQQDQSLRKISVSVPLSHPDDYEGGYLEVNNHGNHEVVPREQGSIAMFPSYCLHRVIPVTRGERWAMVIWIHGPDRFK